MAIPNYTCLKLKMPGPHGIITIGTSFQRAYECEVECCGHASAVIASEELVTLRKEVSEGTPDAKKLSVFWNRGSLNQRVNLCCVPLIPDGDAKRHKVYTGSGNRGPMSSLRDRSCIPCTGVLVVGVTS